jgi:phosphatidylglycerophosphatase A
MPSEEIPSPRQAGTGARRGWAVWLATGLGVGYGPVMPGTYGSALGVGLYLVLAGRLKTLPHPWLLFCMAALAITALSIPVVAVALRSFNVQDPQEVVLDEVVGQLLTLLPLPLVSQRGASYWTAMALGFLLFRALDAAKPYPIWKLERLKGAWGVVADDVGAGIVAAILLGAAIRLSGWRL